jgi:S-adenosylmethionine:tRNA-ribosyltransferase-isomerase (queuine synthetase)
VHDLHAAAFVAVANGSRVSTVGTTQVATLPNGVTETGIQNQVAAATSVILNQLQYEVGAA